MYFITERATSPSEPLENTLKNRNSTPNYLNNYIIIISKNLNISYSIYNLQYIKISKLFN